MTTSQNIAHRSSTSIRLAIVASLWGLAVIYAAASGLLAMIYMPLIAVLVAAGIVLPTLCYFASPSLRHWADQTGLLAITAFHIWRIPAALLFFWYGFQGHLPTPFWVLAGVGDLLAGCFAAWVVAHPKPTEHLFKAMHRFGFADFVIAVGTGLTFTLLLDPRMTLLATLPFALIPLFGVGISGASHIIAFDMMRRAGKT